MLNKFFVFLTVVVVVTICYYVYWWKPKWEPKQQINTTYVKENGGSKIEDYGEIEDTPLGCYTAGGDGLPDILDKTPSEKSIYLIETSCTSYTKGKIFITPRQACAVESAAFNNPDFQTYLIYASPGSIKDDNTVSDRLLQILTNIVNVKVVRSNYARLLKGSVVEELYTKGRIQSSKYPVNIASDIARLLILFKYGGIYLDLDTVTIKSFNDLALNFAGAESQEDVNNAVIRSSVNGSGHEFIKMCLQELKEHFKGDKWGYTGPLLVTKILTEMCGVKKIKEAYNKNCSGFSVYSTEKFNPIFFRKWRLYFENDREKEMTYLMEKSYVLHLWNKFSKNTVSNSSRSIYRYAAEKYCPQVHSIAREYF